MLLFSHLRTRSKIPASEDPKLSEDSAQIVEKAPRANCLNSALHLSHFVVNQRLPPASISLGATFVAISGLLYPLLNS